MMEMGRRGEIGHGEWVHKVGHGNGCRWVQGTWRQWRLGHWVLGGSGMEMGSGHTGSAMEMDAGCTGMAMENGVLGVFRRGDMHRLGHRAHGGWS